MKQDLIAFVLGLATAEVIYLFRSVISTWLKNKETAAAAELAKVTNTKMTVTTNMVTPPVPTV